LTVTTLELIGFFSCAAAVVGWLLRLEGRLHKALTREEHERICSANQAVIVRKLDDLTGEQRAYHAESRAERVALFHKISTLENGTAVLAAQYEHLREQISTQRDRFSNYREHHEDHSK